MFRTLSLVFCLVAASQQIDISKFSVPEAVEKGSDAELLCEHDGIDEQITVKWFWSPGGPDTRKQIYQRVAGGQRQVIMPHMETLLNITLIDEDKHNLALWDLQPEHSGTFECQVEEEKGDHQERKISSDMVVYSIGDDLSLIFTREESEEVLVQCEAFGVAPKPDITISYDSTTFNTTVVEGPIDGLYNVSTNATLNRQDIEDKEVSCELSFADTDAITSDALKVSQIYHSDAWSATSTTAPDETTDTTEVQAALETQQTTPNNAERAVGAWALAGLAVLLQLRL